MAAEKASPATGTGQKGRPAKTAETAAKAPTKRVAPRRVSAGAPTGAVKAAKAANAKEAKTTKAADATNGADATSATKAANATKEAKTTKAVNATNGAKATDGAKASSTAKATSAAKATSGAKAKARSATPSAPSAPAAPETRARRSPPAPGSVPPPHRSLLLLEEAADRRGTDQPTPPPTAVTPPLPEVDFYIPIVEPKKTSRGLVAAIVVGGLALAGGGIGVFLGTRSHAPSKSAFIAHADAICGPQNAPVAALVKPTSSPDLSTAAGTVATTTKAQADQLRGLDRPGGADRVQIDAVVTSLDGTSQAAQRLHDSAGGGNDPGTVAATKEMKGAFSNATAAAATYGFSACATGLKAGVDAVFGGSQTVIKAVFVAKADTVCRAGARELAAIPDPGNASRFVQALNEATAITDRMQAELGTLPVPPGDEGTVADMLSAQAKVNAKRHEFTDAISARNRTAVDATGHEIDTLTTAADAKWDAYGLSSCGTNFGED